MVVYPPRRLVERRGLTDRCDVIQSQVDESRLAWFDQNGREAWKSVSVLLYSLIRLA
jgi:hypothetical protein